MLCLIAESIEGCVLTCCLRLLYCCIYPVNKIGMNCKIKIKEIQNGELTTNTTNKQQDGSLPVTCRSYFCTVGTLFATNAISDLVLAQI